MLRVEALEPFTEQIPGVMFVVQGELIAEVADLTLEQNQELKEYFEDDGLIFTHALLVAEKQSGRRRLAVALGHPHDPSLKQAYLQLRTWDANESGIMIVPSLGSEKMFLDRHGCQGANLSNCLSIVSPTGMIKEAGTVLIAESGGKIQIHPLEGSWSE